MRSTTLRTALGAFVAAVALGVTGCSAGSTTDAGAVATTTPVPASPSPDAQPSAAATPSPSDSDGGTAGAAAALAGAFQPAGDPATLARDIDAPWSIVQLANGTVLVDERDSGAVKEVLPDGSAGAIGTVPGVVASGEGGLLGLADYVEGDQTWLYAYLTSASDNRVIRMPLVGSAGAYSLGAASDVLTGIPKAGNHNGGRILFGPDGMLYITAGDANQSANAQRVESLSGKILRVTPTGAVPGDNPFAGSPVYSLGHRNPQGMAWAADGTMYAAEFGQDTWDELNVITAGANYGWPVVEGVGGGDDSFTKPIAQWPTDDASPSGLVMAGDTLFMAGLGGQRLWSITVPQGAGGASGAPVITSFYDGSYGRIRDVAVTPEGSLLMLTNNTDGRGSPGADDDRLLSVPLAGA